MWDWNIINFILQIIAMLLIPFTVWLLKTVMAHANKLSLLEQKVNDSVSNRLNSLEAKMANFENKLEAVNLNIVKNNTILDHLSQNISHVIKKMEQNHE